MNRALAAVLSILVALAVFLVPAGSSASAAEPGTISGTVTGPGGGRTRIHTQAQVQVLDGATWQVVENAYTGYFGDYRSEPLAPGTYRVEFSNMDYITEVSAPVTVTGDGATVVDAVLDPGARIQGSFTVPAGGPVPDGFITVFALQGDRWVQVDNDLSGPDGSYLVGGLAGGNYKVGFGAFTAPYAPEFYNNVATLEQAQVVAVPAGSTVTGIDVELSTEQLPVPDPPVTSVVMDGLVRIVGTLRVGKRVRAKVKVFEPTDGVTLHYVWKLDGKLVKKASKSSLRLKASMQSKLLSVEVRATAPGLDAANAYSRPKKVRR